MTTKLDRKIAALETLKLSLTFYNAILPIAFYEKEKETYKQSKLYLSHGYEENDNFFEINQLYTDIAALKEKGILDKTSPAFQKLQKRLEDVLNGILEQQGKGYDEALIQCIDNTIDAVLLRLPPQEYIEKAPQPVLSPLPSSNQSDLSGVGQLMAALGKALMAIVQGVKALVIGGASFFKPSQSSDMNEKSIGESVHRTILPT